VMVERGKKKRVVACAFDWPGWDRSARSEEDALRVLAAYRPRYAKVAALAGLADDFSASGDLSVVERVEGNGMTDLYGVSGRSAEPEQEQMSEAACERKIALLRASWTYFDDVASRVSAELRQGPRGGGRDREDRPPRQRHRDPGERQEAGCQVVARRLEGPRRVMSSRSRTPTRPHVKSRRNVPETGQRITHTEWSRSSSARPKAGGLLSQCAKESCADGGLRSQVRSMLNGCAVTATDACGT